MRATIKAIETIKEIALDAYLECASPRSEADMAGHDYAFKTGYAISAFRRILKELGVELAADEEEEDDE